MKLYWRIFCMVIQKFILRRNTGVIILRFCRKMGVVYIKMAQILAMQNYGQVFNEEDRRRLSKICDHCNPISFSKIRQIIDQEYQGRTAEIFKTIDPEPIGSASISQVHRAKLKDGRQVVLKVKREDVVRSVEHDVRQIRRLIHAFGHFAKFRIFLVAIKLLNFGLTGFWRKQILHMNIKIFLVTNNLPIASMARFQANIILNFLNLFPNFAQIKSLLWSLLPTQLLIT